MGVSGLTMTLSVRTTCKRFALSFASFFLTSVSLSARPTMPPDSVARRRFGMLSLRTASVNGPHAEGAGQPGIVEERRPLVVHRAVRGKAVLEAVLAHANRVHVIVAGALQVMARRRHTILQAQPIAAGCVRHLVHEGILVM